MKTWIITSAFCKSKMLEQCLEHVYMTHNMVPHDVTHVIIDNHYPVDKDDNRDRIHELATRFRCTLVDSGSDLGLHHGQNNAIKVLNIPKEDLLIFLDPDDRPNPEAFEDLSVVIKADPTLAILGLNPNTFDPFKDPSKRPDVIYKEEIIAGRNVWIHPTVEMWTTYAVRMSFLENVGGLNELRSHYGGLESYLYPKWVSLGMRLGYLVNSDSDYAPVDRNDPHIIDQSYVDWKYEHGYLGTYTDSFETYLKDENV